ncbi:MULTISPECIES: hypothetical protein [Burkholderia]|uniref:hypothetical protein n=1 Tax=Burkholderia TaxID=32008 RepID=UPI000BF31C90|nr:hypothetical protein [Burkholderia sp. JKS000303]PFH12851.1 hypothetical protein BX604_7271 [Burkholderia sp. JKS000303]
MSITNAQIQGIAAPRPLVEALEALNSSTLTADAIAQLQVSTEEKNAMLAVLNSTATRVGINSMSISLPVKSVLLAIAGV